MPKYVYGSYHSKSDGENRKIIKNSHINEETYKYVRYDYYSSKQGASEQNIEGPNI